MTAAARSPMAVEGDFPDPEVLLADILAAVEVDGRPLGVGQVDTDVSGLEPPCIRCYVPPGRRQLNRYGDVDISFVYVQTWAPQRRLSQDMLRQVRGLFTAFTDGGLHRGVQLFRLRETTGPGVLPQQPDAPDELVESGWTAWLRRHRGPTVQS